MAGSFFILEKATEIFPRHIGAQFLSSHLPFPSYRAQTKAAYYGIVGGREHADKMRFSPTIEKGVVLNVPTIAESPVSMELQVIQEIHLNSGSDVFLCKIMGETMREDLTNKDVPFIERYKSVKQVLCGGEQHYVSMDGRDLGSWGEPMKNL